MAVSAEQELEDAYAKVALECPRGQGGPAHRMTFVHLRRAESPRTNCVFMHRPPLEVLEIFDTLSPAQALLFDALHKITQRSYRLS